MSSHQSAGSGADPLPEAIAAALDRLRQVLGRIPGGIAAAIRRPNAAGGKAGTRPGDLLANLRPVFVRLAAEFSGRISAGFGEIEAGFRRAQKQVFRGFRRARKGLGRTWRRGFRRAGRNVARASRRRYRGARRGLAQARKSLVRRFRRAQKGLMRGFRRAQKRFGKALRRGFRGARRGFGRAFRRGMRRMRVGTRAALRTLRSGRGAGRAFGVFASKATGISALGAIGPALSAVVKAGEAMKAFAERQNDSNRWLAPYSGRLSAAFGRQAMGDERRNLQLARDTEGSAAALADTVNGLSDATQGFKRFWASLNNRAGVAAGEFVMPAYREVGKILDQISDVMERKDPAAKNSAGFVQGIHAGAAGVAGWFGGLFSSGFDVAAANKAAMEAARQVELDRNAGKAIDKDGWTNWMEGAMNLPQLNPVRKFVP